MSVVKPVTGKNPDGTLRDDQMLAFGVVRRIGVSNGFGFAVLGSAIFGDDNPMTGIYQRRLSGYNQHTGPPHGRGHVYYVKMRDYAPTNPQTAPQQAQRAKMADACQAWNDLTTEQKANYNKRGKRINRVGRQIFIQEYLKSN